MPFLGVILLFICGPDFTVIESGNDRINLCSDGLKVCGKLLTTPVLVSNVFIPTTLSTKKDL